MADLEETLNCPGCGLSQARTAAVATPDDPNPEDHIHEDVPTPLPPSAEGAGFGKWDELQARHPWAEVSQCPGCGQGSVTCNDPFHGDEKPSYALPKSPSDVWDPAAAKFTEGDLEGGHVPESPPSAPLGMEDLPQTKRKVKDLEGKGLVYHLTVRDPDDGGTSHRHVFEDKAEAVRKHKEALDSGFDADLVPVQRYPSEHSEQFHGLEGRPTKGDFNPRGEMTASADGQCGDWCPATEKVGGVWDSVYDTTVRALGMHPCKDCHGKVGDQDCLSCQGTGVEQFPDDDGSKRESKVAQDAGGGGGDGGGSAGASAGGEGAPGSAASADCGGSTDSCSCGGTHTNSGCSSCGCRGFMFGGYPRERPRPPEHHKKHKKKHAADSSDSPPSVECGECSKKFPEFMDHCPHCGFKEGDNDDEFSQWGSQADHVRQQVRIDEYNQVPPKKADHEYDDDTPTCDEGDGKPSLTDFLGRHLCPDHLRYALEDAPSKLQKAQAGVKGVSGGPERLGYENLVQTIKRDMEKGEQALKDRDIKEQFSKGDHIGAVGDPDDRTDLCEYCEGRGLGCAFCKETGKTMTPTTEERINDMHARPLSDTTRNWEHQLDAPFVTNSSADATAWVRAAFEDLYPGESIEFDPVEASVEKSAGTCHECGGDGACQTCRGVGNNCSMCAGTGDCRECGGQGWIEDYGSESLYPYHGAKLAAHDLAEEDWAHPDQVLGRDEDGVPSTPNSYEKEAAWTPPPRSNTGTKCECGHPVDGPTGHEENGDCQADNCPCQVLRKVAAAEVEGFGGMREEVLAYLFDNDVQEWARTAQNLGCPNCNGTGSTPDGHICPACFGTGHGGGMMLHNEASADAVGILYGDDGDTYQSTDGGETWEKVGAGDVAPHDWHHKVHEIDNLSDYCDEGRHEECPFEDCSCPHHVEETCPHGLSSWLCADPINHYPREASTGSRDGEVTSKASSNADQNLMDNYVNQKDTEVQTPGGLAGPGLYTQRIKTRRQTLHHDLIEDAFPNESVDPKPTEYGSEYPTKSAALEGEELNDDQKVAALDAELMRDPYEMSEDDLMVDPFEVGVEAAPKKKRYPPGHKKTPDEVEAEKLQKERDELKKKVDKATDVAGKGLDEASNILGNPSKQKHAAINPASGPDGTSTAELTDEVGSGEHPVPIEFITDHRGEVAPGQDPAACRTCGRAMEWHAQWSPTHQGAVVRSSWANTETYDWDQIGYFDDVPPVERSPRRGSISKEAHQPVYDVSLHDAQGPQVGESCKFCGEPSNYTYGAVKAYTDPEDPILGRVVAHQSHFDEYRASAPSVPVPIAPSIGEGRGVTINVYASKDEGDK